MIERREALRYKVVLPALCFGEARPEFYAVTDDVSVGGIRFKSATRVRPDETLTCRIRHIGAVEARVIRIEPASFVAKVLTRRPAADHIARGLVMVAKRQVDPHAPARVHARIVPRRRDVRVALADGATVTGALLNVSASGAGLIVDPSPEPGAVITLGRTVARVARHFDGGIGVIFLKPFDPAEVTEDIVL